jgi:hypothetical protein
LNSNKTAVEPFAQKHARQRLGVRLPSAAFHLPHQPGNEANPERCANALDQSNSPEASLRVISILFLVGILSELFSDLLPLFPAVLRGNIVMTAPLKNGRYA